MFKRLHSNREPGVTVCGELKKEFAVYFGKAGNCVQSIAAGYPKLLFGSMVILMVVSLVLSFTVFNQPVTVGRQQDMATKEIKPLNDGFELILRTGTALKETINIKKEVDSITAKKVLTAADSALLEQALSRLQQLNNPLTIPK